MKTKCYYSPHPESPLDLHTQYVAPAMMQQQILERAKKISIRSAISTAAKRPLHWRAKSENAQDSRPLVGEVDFSSREGVASLESPSGPMWPGWGKAWYAIKSSVGVA